MTLFQIFLVLHSVLFSLVLTSPSTDITDIIPVPLRNHTKSPAFKRIIGGNRASNQFPWQASIISCTGSNCVICGGSLISQIYVLTAAHCTQDSREFDIGLGSNQLRMPAVRLRSTSKIVHSRYDSKNLVNDIALIRLPRKVKLTNTVQLVKLATSGMGQLENRRAVVSGFGKTSGRVSLKPFMTSFDLPI